MRGVAQRRHGNQAARVHSIDGGVGAKRGVGGGLELRLVVDAVEVQPAGEVDQHLLLIEIGKQLDGGLQRIQLAVGGEEIELAIVLAEGAAVIGGAVVTDDGVEPLGLADEELVDSLDDARRGRR